MSDQENCNHDCGNCSETCSSCTMTKADFLVQPGPHSKIKKIIGVVSGKGGVGKSLVTSLLAVELKKQGKKVAVLDADITGPSIPKAFGITEKAVADDRGILPVLSKGGIKVMSVNLLLEDEDAPVIWRGPVIAGTVKQFYTEVAWGDVDYMLVDMPPGTGDVPLTVFQSLPLDGIVIVTSPQELVSMIVSKAVNMANSMDVKVLGIVENMSYFECPDCHKKYQVFGESHVDEISNKFHLPVLAKLPIDSNLAKLCDLGKVEDADSSVIQEAVLKMA